MPIVNKTHRAASPLSLDTRGSKKAHQSIFSESAGSTSPIDKCEDSYSPSDGPIAMAICWLMACLVESFAAYGTTMHRSLAGPGERIDRQQPKQYSPPGGHNKNVNGIELLQLQGGHPATNEETTRSADMQIASPVRTTSLIADVRSQMRRRRKQKLTVTELEALDDYVLKDIGLHRCQIERVARHWDLYRW